MNGFEAHGIEHSSASQINMFANAPDAWLAKYIYKREFAGNNAMEIGNLAERYICDVLTERLSLDEAIEKSNNVLSGMTAESDADTKRFQAVPGMIQNGVEVLSPYGVPEIRFNKVQNSYEQKKIELTCNLSDCSIPIIGYLDFYYPEKKLVIDLKTTMRLPSVMSHEHIRQGALYRAATGFETRFVYVSGKGAKDLAIPEDVSEVLTEIKAILTRQERLLRAGELIELKDIMPVISSSFYWNGNEDVRKGLYGV